MNSNRQEILEKLQNEIQSEQNRSKLIFIKSWEEAKRKAYEEFSKFFIRKGYAISEEVVNAALNKKNIVASKLGQKLTIQSVSKTSFFKITVGNTDYRVEVMVENPTFYNREPYLRSIDAVGTVERLEQDIEQAQKDLAYEKAINAGLPNVIASYTLKPDFASQRRAPLYAHQFSDLLQTLFSSY